MDSLKIASFACGASALALWSSAASAQTETANSDDPGTSEPDTIIVTAQKREQSLEDVPVSVAVIDKEFIDRQDIRDLTDYLDLVPGLTGETNGASGDGINVRIRGIGALGGNTNTFGVYVDGFDTTGSTSALAGSRLVDPERVEVLRGPQGTAFGRNVVAGAISITSLTPSTDRVSGRIAVDAGNNGVFGATGRVNVPLTDKAAVLISGFYDRTDGFIDNLTPSGSPEDEQENYGFRGSIQWDPNDRLSIKASASYERLSQELQSQVPNGESNPSIENFFDIISAGFNPFIDPEDIVSPLPSFFPEQASFAETDTPEFLVRENTIATLNVSYDLGDASLVWVSGVAHSERRTQTDGDFSSLNNVITRGSGHNTFASTELRYQSNGDNRFDYVAGVFLSHGDEESFFRSEAGETLRLSTFLPPALLGPVAPLLPNPYFVIQAEPGEPLTQNSQDVRTFGAAVFADIDYEITDRWQILLGGRYNYDEERQSVTDVVDIQQIDFTIPGIGPVPVPFAPSVAFPPASGEVDFDQFTWRVSTVYDVSDSINLYGTVSTGYRPGGLQLTNVGLDGQTEQLDFEPEEITNYEIGFKSNFFNNRLLLNAALFYLDWESIQLSVVNPTTGIPFAGNGQAEALGFEVDMIVNPFAGFTLQGGLSYLDSEVTDLEGGIAGQALVGLPLPYAPQWQGTATANYDFAISDSIDGFVRATFVHVGERNDVLAGGEAAFILDDYQRLDVRAGFLRENNWRFEGFVTNVTDEIYATGAFTNGFAARGQILRVAPPRQYGVRIVKEF